MLHIFRQLQTAQSSISPSIYIQFKLIYPTSARHFCKKTSVCIYDWVGVCSPARGCPKWILGVFLVHSPPYLLKQGLSPNLKLYPLKQDLSLNLKPVDSELARVSVSPALGLQSWLFTWVLGSELQSSHSPGKCCTFLFACLLGDSNSFIYSFIIFLLLPLKLCHWKHSPSLGQGFWHRLYEKPAESQDPTQTFSMRNTILTRSLGTSWANYPFGNTTLKHGYAYCL